MVHFNTNTAKDSRYSRAEIGLLDEEGVTCSLSLNRKGEIVRWIEGTLPHLLESCYIGPGALPCIYRIFTPRIREEIQEYLSTAQRKSRALQLASTAVRLHSDIRIYSVTFRPFFTDMGEQFICTMYPSIYQDLEKNGWSLEMPEASENCMAASFENESDCESCTLECDRKSGNAIRQDAADLLYDLNHLYDQSLTDLKESNSFLRQLQYHSQVTSLVFDHKFRLKKFVPQIGNQAGTSIYDLDNAFRQVLHVFDPAVVNQLYKVARKVKQDKRSRGRKVEDKLGNQILVRLFPFGKSAETATELLLTLTDINAIQETRPVESPSLTGSGLVFESTPDVYLLFDSRGYIRNCNRRAHEMLGYRSRRDIIGRHLGDFSAPNNSYKVEEKLKQLRSGLSVVGLHKVVLGKDNHQIPVEVHANPVLDEKGKIISYMAVWRDMRELRRSETMVSTLLTSFPNSTDDFWDWDMVRGSYTSCHSIQDWFGFSTKEIPDTALGWYSLAYPDDIRRYKQVLRAHIHSRGKQPFSLEMRFRNKEGGTVYVFFRGRVVEWSPKGRPLRMMGTQVDISHLNKVPELEQKLYEQNRAFDEIMESTLSGYWDWNFETGVEYMSSTFKRMFGYSDSEMPDRPESWQRIIHPEDLKTLWKNFELHAQSRGGIPFENELRFYHKNGHIVWVWCRGKVVEWNKEGNPVRMIGSHTDITRLKDLDQTNKELERFAYIASHDLQEPLRTITDFSHLLRDEYGGQLNEEALMYIDFISKSAQQMSTLVRDILTYSRSTGQTTKERVDLNEIYKRTLMNQFSVISEKQAEIESDALPVVFGNETELFSLFMNLIGNALKFNQPDRPPRIRISASTTPTHWNITFSDQGIGIADEDQERIFEIFQRLHNREDYEGNGIGLAHCLRIAQNHGGTIEVNSEKNKGSEFVVSISKSE